MLGLEVVRLSAEVNSRYYPQFLPGKTYENLV